MKTIIATTLVALTFAAPAAADTSAAQALFALSNDSAAERVLNADAGSNGPIAGVAEELALYNDSAAERVIEDTSSLRRKAARDGAITLQEVKQQFALGNDSAAERIVN